MVLVGMLLVVVEQLYHATGQRQRLFLATQHAEHADLAFCSNDIGIEFVELKSVTLCGSKFFTLHS